MESGFFTEHEFHTLVNLAHEREIEAQKCAEAGAVYAGCILGAAAIEAMLLATCELLPGEVKNAASKLEIHDAIQRWGLHDLLEIATAAGWLETDPGDGSKPDITMLTEIVRRVRNLVHPAAHLRELGETPLPTATLDLVLFAIDAVREKLAYKLRIDLPART